MVHAIPTLPRIPIEEPARPSPRAPLALRAVRTAFKWFGPWAPEALADWATRLYFSPRRHPVSPRDAQWLVGSDLEWIETERGRIAVYAWPYGGLFPWEQPRERGNVLLVHGWEGRGAQLGAFVDPLRTAGYRVVAFDAPAHGRSSGQRATLFGFSRAIQRVAELHGPFDAVIAHSMGVPSVALAIAQGFEVERAVLIGGPSRFDRVTSRFARELAMNDAIEAHFRGNLEAKFGDDVWEKFDAQALTENTPESLILHDVDDRFVHFSEAEHLAASWDRARLIATAGLGHHRILRDPMVLETSVRFLAGEGGLRRISA
ncbi:MAG: alpha/beta hydrolase [Deltaproteobacteria bacterium]|jgi:pimeloyl-ACP methyl ester carboxylesterase